MEKQIICIDISNVVPGKGGTGGGITTYAINLIKHLDSLLNDNNFKIYCIKNSELTSLGEFNNITTIDVKVNNSNIFSRLYWLHVRLPFFCKKKEVTVLHRIVPELPAIKVCKYIITLHDFMFDFYLQNSHLKKYLDKANIIKFRLFRKFCHLSIGVSDGIIVPADTILDELKKMFRLKNKKAVTIHEASEFPGHKTIEKKQAIVNDNELNIGVVAGFYPHKGHFKILKLATIFLDLGFTDFKIFLRGSKVYKPYVSDVEKEIVKLGLEDFVKFEPFVKKISLEEIYAAFDLVLLLSEYEGFGLPVLEAQSNSVPVACSRIPIFEEVLRKSAIYLNPDFSREDAADFLKEIRNKEHLKEKTEEGLNNVARFSWSTMAGETLSLYKYFIK
ncbi:MAG: glycosyltransferase [Ginsengibacter sp.]